MHIPFCKKACHYCNFHFSTSLRLKNGFLAAILREIDLTPEKKDVEIASIYLGGGTPSLLEISEVEQILTHLRSRFDIVPEAEITLEANPDDMTLEKANAWRALGINRLSIGIQSFRESDLIWMNRSHSAAQALQCIAIAQKAGFENLSIDLIFGSPGLDMKAWTENIEKALSMQIPHLSCYALTVEPRTALDGMIRRNKKAGPDADMQAEQFLKLMEMTEAAGYEQYEISNYALPGMRSRHNSSYWEGIPYFGFGPAAHSFDGSARKWNIANNAAYIKALAEDRIPYEIETLTDTQHLNEYVMTSLRTSNGLNLERIVANWGAAERDRLIRDALPYSDKGLVSLAHGQMTLTREGKLFADGIAAELFKSER